MVLQPAPLLEFLNCYLPLAVCRAHVSAIQFYSSLRDLKDVMDAKDAWGVSYSVS
ncbi:MAG: hypothetical protein PHO53_06925 [Actinomycetota bacterium]|nr:hypothetical protein [Actinomycetota bacterium]